MASQLWGYSPPSFKQYQTIMVRWQWLVCFTRFLIKHQKNLHHPPPTSMKLPFLKAALPFSCSQIHRDDFPGALGMWFLMFQISTRWVLQLQKFGTRDWPSGCFLQSENRYRLPFLSCHENSINFTCQMGGQGCQEWKTCHCQHQ